MTDNKAQHTPGLWEVIDSYRVDGDKRIWINAPANGNRTFDQPVCNLYEDSTPSDAVYTGGWESRFDNAEANASRIVAAVNACEGISTEALEGGVVSELLEALEASAAQLEEVYQRYLEIDTRVDANTMETLKLVESVIRKARGK